MTFSHFWLTPLALLLAFSNANAETCPQQKTGDQICAGDLVIVKDKITEKKNQFSSSEITIFDVNDFQGIEKRVIVKVKDVKRDKVQVSIPFTKVKNIWTSLSLKEAGFDQKIQLKTKERKIKKDQVLLVKTPPEDFKAGEEVVVLSRYFHDGIYMTKKYIAYNFKLAGVLDDGTAIQLKTRPEWRDMNRGFKNAIPSKKDVAQRNPLKIGRIVAELSGYQQGTEILFPQPEDDSAMVGVVEAVFSNGLLKVRAKRPTGDPAQPTERFWVYVNPNGQITASFNNSVLAID